RALRYGGGAVIVQTDGVERLFSERLFCPACSLGFEALDPRLFSFNSRQGACPACRGTGGDGVLDPEAIVDPARSLAGGALLPFERPELRAEKRKLLRALAGQDVPLERAFGKLGGRQRRLVLEGGPGFPGAIAVLTRALEDTDGEVLAAFS